nr:unnamed protein product [Callosobruchus analis]
MRRQEDTPLGVIVQRDICEEMGLAYLKMHVDLLNQDTSVQRNVLPMSSI